MPASSRSRSRSREADDQHPREKEATARAYSELREQSGQGMTDAWPGSAARLDRGYDRILAITRSGTTTEILDTLGAYRASGGTAPVTIITATPDTPVQDKGDVITLAQFDEVSVVQTRFATSALALLRAHLGEDISPAIALIPGFERDVAATGAHLKHRDIDPMAELVRVHLLCLAGLSGLAL